MELSSEVAATDYLIHLCVCRYAYSLTPLRVSFYPHQCHVDPLFKHWICAVVVYPCGSEAVLVGWEDHLLSASSNCKGNNVTVDPFVVHIAKKQFVDVGNCFMSLEVRNAYHQTSKLYQVITSKLRFLIYIYIYMCVFSLDLFPTDYKSQMISQLGFGCGKTKLGYKKAQLTWSNRDR